MTNKGGMSMNSTVYHISLDIQGVDSQGMLPVKAGDTVSIAAYNPEAYPYIKMTVKGPDGQVIENLSSVTLAAGTYTVTFSHDTIGDASGDTGYYYLRHDYGGCYSTGGAVKTVTFTVS